MKTMKMRLGTAAVVLGMVLCGWSGDEWPDRSRVAFGTYCLAKRYRTEATFKDMKACGIDFVCENFGGDPQSVETMRKLGLVSVCAGGFPTYWGGVDSVNGHIAELAPLEKYEAARKAYQPSPVDRMVNFGDELSALDFPHLGRAMSHLAASGLRQAPYLNLHPCIHQGANVARYYGASNYVAYVDAYVKHIPLDYISYDIYPYQFRERREWGFARFYENARIVADACRDSGRAFWYIPQANSFRPDDVTTANKMRYQAYAALAFGAETLTWACWTAGWWTNNVLNADGTRTAQYDRLKEVIAEIHRFDRDYMRFRRVQTHFTGFTGAAAKWIEPDPKTGIPRVNFDTPHHVSTAFFDDIRGTDGLPLVVGEFVPRNGTGRERAILVFAADDPWDEHPADRVVSFRTAYRVRVVGPDGEVKVTRSADGRYEIPLRSSRCAFVMGVPPTCF